MWKVLFILVIGGALWGIFGKRWPEYRLQHQMEATVRQTNAMLPQVYGNALRLEHVDYANHVMHAAGVVLASVDVDDSRKAVIQHNLKDLYCLGAWKPFADARVAVEVSLTFESAFYRNIEWAFKVEPENC